MGQIMETFGSAELWNLRASPMLVGTDAKRDLALPGNVRRYYFPSVMHGSSWNSGFKGEPTHAALTGASMRLPGNPNPSGETLRALKQRLVDWVVSGKGKSGRRHGRLVCDHRGRTLSLEAPGGSR
jgi:hypothetical protein